MSRIRTLHDSPLLTFAVISDTHIDMEDHPTPVVPEQLLWIAVRDASRSKKPLDAFVITGDTTSHGEKVNWDAAKKVFASAGKPSKNFFIQIGNHDTWAKDSEEAAVERYFEYTTEITGNIIDKTYFSRVVNGFWFIFLSSERENSCGAYISEEQLKWFSETLNKACESGKPVFVFSHQPLNGRHGLPMTADADGSPDDDPMEGGIGVSSPEVEKILSGRKNVWFFSGHSHMGLSGEDNFRSKGFASFEDDGDVHFVNLPSLACGNHHGEYSKLGCGIVCEVYEDSLIIRPREFKTHRWINKVNISSGKPYYLKNLT